MLISLKESTNNGHKDLSNQNKNATDSVISQVVEIAIPEKAEHNKHDTQELAVTPVESENTAKSVKLKLSSSGKSCKGK